MRTLYIFLIIFPLAIWSKPGFDEGADNGLTEICKKENALAFCSIVEKFK